MDPRNVGTLLDVRSKGLSRHKIGGEFHDDRMNEMQEIKEALLGMVPSKKSSLGGEDFKFYITSVMHMVNVTMRASLDEQFAADQAMATAALEHFETCKKILVTGLSWPNAILEGGSHGDEAYSGLSVYKKAHNACRGVQNQKKKIYDLCVDEQKRLKDANGNGCKAKYEAYRNKTQECDMRQDSLDALSCQQALGRHERCGDYDHCYGEAEYEWKAAKISICGKHGKEGALDEELEQIEQIGCVISALTSDDPNRKASQCMTNATKRDGTFSFPECQQDKPEKDETQNCGNHLEPLEDEDMAGTESYVEKYYKGYPLEEKKESSDHAPVVDVKVCVAPCCIKATAAGEGKQRIARRHAANLTHTVKEKCITPKKTDDGYIVYEGSLFMKHFHVRAQCAEGYKGKAVIVPCAKKGEPYKLTGCEPIMCLAPSAEEKIDYQVSEKNLMKHFFSVNAQCKGLGKAVVKACKADQEPYMIFGCLPFTCTSKVSKEGYEVLETSKRLDSWDVKASCLHGYEGTAKVTKCEKPLTPYTLEGCSPIKCAMAVHKELRDYDITVVDMHVPSFSIGVQCHNKGGVVEEGLVPTAVPCTKSGEPFTLKNCKVVECTSPRASVEDGFVVYEGSRRMDKFDVRAECAKGYKGEAKVEICSDAEEPYLLSGCGPKHCIEPTPRASKYYKLEVVSREIPSFAVRASCGAFAHGVAKVTACKKDGAPFNLAGCEADTCRSWPGGDFNQGYVVFEKSILMENFEVAAKCADGFKGHAEVEICSKHDESYTLTGCTPKSCTLPSAEDAYDYEYVPQSLFLPTFSVFVKCKYQGTGVATVCADDGKPFTLSGCEPIPCETPADMLDKYALSEQSLNPKEFNVSAGCVEGYMGQVQVSVCSKGGLPYSVSGCVPKRCTAPDEKTSHAYKVVENNLEIPNFNVSVKCKGKAATGSTTEAVVCKDNEQTYTLQGCAPLECAPMPKCNQTGYTLLEDSLQILEFDVEVGCADGYYGDAPKAEVCDKEGGSYTLSGCSPMVCVEPPAEELHDYNVTVKSLYVPNFHVNASCKGEGVPKVTPCTKHGGAFHVSGCKPQACLSPRKTAGHGYVVYETFLSYKDFDVMAKCADGYHGDAVVKKCAKGGEPYSLSGCSAFECTEPKDVPFRYTYSVYSLATPSFSVSVRCRGHNSSVPKAIPCKKAGEPFTLSGCLPLECTSPLKTNASVGYTVQEYNRMSDSFRVTAKCADGYHGKAKVQMCSKPETPYELSGCKPIICVAPKEIETYSYDLTERSLEVPSFSVTARCKTKALTGKTPKAIPCTQDGDTYTVEGCYPASCTSPSEEAEEGYVVYEENKLMSRFAVTATCGEAYEGVAQVSMCQEPGEPFEVSGCYPGNCTAPSKKYSEAYNLTIYSLQRPKFSVIARCAFAPHLMGEAIPCTGDKEPFALKGCPLGECKAPYHANVNDGYVVYEANRRLGTFNVTAKCADGYHGKAVVQECSGHGETYGLSGCKPEKCVEPSDSEKEAYNLTVYNTDRPKFSITAACRYTGGYGRAVPCTKDGGAYTLEGCYLGTCTSPRAEAEDGYVVYEANKMIENFTIHAKCAAGYKGVAVATKCKSHKEPYSLSGCTPEVCVEPGDAEKEAYDVTVYSLEKPSFSATAKCKYGGCVVNVTACTGDGLPYILKGCSPHGDITEQDPNNEVLEPLDT